MDCFTELQRATATERTHLLAAPILQEALAGRATRPQYLAFLAQAYHHVRHTAPLLMACGARLPDRLEWLRSAVAEYIEEEIGHQEWILDDITAAGGDADAVRASAPAFETEVMVAYAYDTIARRNPVGFFGMVYVLEGTSVELATQLAGKLSVSLDLPPSAFTYLSSHGCLDQQHIMHFQSLVNRLEDPADRAALIHGAQVFFRLYGDVIRSLPMGEDAMSAFRGKTFLVTGATGGIGGAVALALARRGARLVLLGRHAAALAARAREAEAAGGEAHVVVADLAQGDVRPAVSQAIAAWGALDGVVNCAGVQTFGLADEEDPADTERLFATNVLAPIHLIQALLPHLRSRPLAHVVNVGSIFGSIGFPCFASYSASKYALRGYSEALRRELADSRVRVHYVAPRYTRTGFNQEPVARMAEALGMRQDSPEDVAAQTLAAIARDAADTFLGWPEKLFVRINALLPRLVDKALSRQARQMRPFLRRRLAAVS